MQWLADWLLANNPNKALSFAEADLHLDPNNEEDANFFVTEPVPAAPVDAEVNPNPETRNPKPETWNPKPKAPIPNP